MLFRPGFLAEVELLDKRFLLYYEDTDLSWRGIAEGWRYRFVPGPWPATATRPDRRGLAHRPAYVERNRLMMLIKNAPAPIAARAVSHYLPRPRLSYARRQLLVAPPSSPAPATTDPSSFHRRGAPSSFSRLTPPTLAAPRRLGAGPPLADPRDGGLGGAP